MYNEGNCHLPDPPIQFILQPLDDVCPVTKVSIPVEQGTSQDDGAVDERVFMVAAVGALLQLTLERGERADDV